MLVTRWQPLVSSFIQEAIQLKVRTVGFETLDLIPNPAFMQ